ncbi:hypothetical protein SNEBB_005287 [Seison nebaliae]|nr:hypothetical protein SNEBB_005287 [Seison nebaliae]
MFHNGYPIILAAPTSQKTGIQLRTYTYVKGEIEKYVSSRRRLTNSLSITELSKRLHISKEKKEESDIFMKVILELCVEYEDRLLRDYDYTEEGEELDYWTFLESYDVAQFEKKEKMKPRIIRMMRKDKGEIDIISIIIKLVIFDYIYNNLNLNQAKDEVIIEFAGDVSCIRAIRLLAKDGLYDMEVL